jgi:hypothetical protein
MTDRVALPSKCRKSLVAQGLPEAILFLAKRVPQNPGRLPASSAITDTCDGGSGGLGCTNTAVIACGNNRGKWRPAKGR